MIGSGLAFGSALFMPAVAVVLARGTQAAFSAGLVFNQAVQRQMLIAMAEATECIEDLVAEARSDATSIDQARDVPVIIPGQAVGGDSAVALTPVSVCLKHGSKCRMRLRILGLVDEKRRTALMSEIAAFPGVRRAAHRPATGSIVMETYAPARDVLRSLEQNGVVRLVGAWFHHPAALVTAFGLDRLDALIRMRSGGRQNLRQAVAMVLRAAEALGRRQLG
ncbi:MAG: hypothetical protein AAF183_13905 [Pseudomonadota bacterium]